MDTSLRDGIDWVGYIDWTVRDFHSYNTIRGATYNAYLVRDEKTALIDTVKGPYAPVLLDHIRAHADPAGIDYIVVNHAEPDHSSGLPAVLEACPKATVVCDAKCRETLEKHYDAGDWSFKTVATGDTLSLGKRTLAFVETPMVHWPDSMVTYMPEEKLLFSMDAFGQHFASSARFDDEVDMCQVMIEAKKYYANIVMPYGRQVQKALAAAGDLDIGMIAPAHGVIWRSHIPEILEAYGRWAACAPAAKVLVLYDTMWGSTAQMAEAIAEGASAEGVTVKLHAIRESGLTEIATEFLDAAAVAFGSATLNMGMMPMAGAVATYMQGLRPTGRAGFAFGSYGWGKGGPEAVDEALKRMKFEILREPLKSQFRPTAEILDQCRAAGGMLAEKALEMAKA